MEVSFLQEYRDRGENEKFAAIHRIQRKKKYAAFLRDITANLNPWQTDTVSTKFPRIQAIAEP